MAKKRFVLAAGGTGGHVFPAIALYREMIAEGHEVLFLTDPRGEGFLTSVPQDLVKVVSSGGLVTGSAFKKIQGLFRLGKGYFSSKRILSKFKPDAVVGFGGYPSAPPLMAAQFKKIPTLLHEQNSVMGKANRLISQNVKAVATSFPSTVGAPDKSIYVGNPIRAEIEAVGTASFVLPTKDEPIKILIMGGSLGARFLSEAIPTALAGLKKELRARLEVVQQVRSEDQYQVVEAYKLAGIKAEVLPFISDVADALASNHLVICRAGATSVAEIAAAGRPTIFIPLDIHADRHQVINAESLANQGAAWVQPQSETSPEILRELIASLLEDLKTLQTVATKARSLAKTGSARALYDLTLSISS